MKLRKGQTPRRKHITAHHEAAHAIIAVHCRVGFEGLILRSSERAAGMLVGVDLRAGQEDDAVRVGLAGIMATRLMYNRWQAGIFDRARDDMDLVARSALKLQNPRHTVEWCVNDNDATLRARWGSIVGVASLLLDRGELGADEIEQAIAASQLGVTPPGSIGDWERLISTVFARADHVKRLELGDPLASLMQQRFFD